MYDRTEPSCVNLLFIDMPLPYYINRLRGFSALVIQMLLSLKRRKKCLKWDKWCILLHFLTFLLSWHLQSWLIYINIIYIHDACRSTSRHSLMQLLGLHMRPMVKVVINTCILNSMHCIFLFFRADYSPFLYLYKYIKGYFTCILDIFWGLFGDPNEGCTSENLNFFSFFFFQLWKWRKLFIYFLFTELLCHMDMPIKLMNVPYYWGINVLFPIFLPCFLLRKHTQWLPFMMMTTFGSIIVIINWWA